MGEIGAALKAVKGAQATAHAAGFGSADTSDPGAQLMSDPLGSIYPQMPDFSGQGMNQAQGGMPQTTAPQMSQEAPQIAPPQAAPIDNPYDGQNYSNPREIAGSIGQGSNDENITVTGDAWKPKKESGVGRLMDTLLELRGRRPVFKDRTDDANLQSAMDGAQGDSKPGFDQEKLISRVRKFNPDLADKMENQFVVQQRLQGNLDRSNEVFDMKKRELVLDRTASAMQTPGLDKDPVAYQKMRDRMIAYGNKYKEDVSNDIPEQWDPDIANIVRYGRIGVKDQTKLEQGDRKLTQGDRRLDQRDTSIGNQDRHNQAMEGTSQQNADTASRNANKRPDKGESRFVDTKNGRMVIRGNQGVIISPDGNQHSFITNDGKHWVHVNTVGPDGKPLTQE